MEGQMEDGIISEGFRMVCYQSKWGHVCADGWDSSDARVACRHLGLPEAIESRSESENDVKSQAILRNADCIGHESSLFSCEHGGLGTDVNCANGRVVWLKCKVFQRTNQFKNVRFNKTFA